jgi:hypothetical protein
MGDGTTFNDAFAFAFEEDFPLYGLLLFSVFCAFAFPDFISPASRLIRDFIEVSSAS